MGPLPVFTQPTPKCTSSFRSASIALSELAKEEQRRPLNLGRKQDEWRPGVRGSRRKWERGSQNKPGTVLFLLFNMLSLSLTEVSSVLVTGLLPTTQKPVWFPEVRRAYLFQSHLSYEEKTVTLDSCLFWYFLPWLELSPEVFLKFYKLCSGSKRDMSTPRWPYILALFASHITDYFNLKNAETMSPYAKTSQNFFFLTWHLHTRFEKMSPPVLYLTM